ncbi:unnamed protein product [Mytilus coruscus]|uniref:DDE Tnp4 domain-containing protein n=1 Tax=Mytilus coruscus TaxID=42192 RepID=A0A6J8EJ16_MYTCO|nr:unnamed protein product [Mytilus coruscus]
MWETPGGFQGRQNQTLHPCAVNILSVVKDQLTFIPTRCLHCYNDEQSIVACTENMTVGCEKGTQTDSLSTEHKEVQTIYEKNFLNAKIENMLLKNEIKFTRCDDKCDSAKSTPLSLHSIKDDDVKMKLFTGLNYEQVLALIEFLADRGFTIEDLLMARQAVLNIPSFLGKRTKFTPEEELKTRRIAKARIHVERVIERVKKFKLLSGNIPLSLSPIADQMVFVASCLVNFQEPLVK